MRAIAYFLIGVLLFWTLVAVPSRQIWGDSAVVFSAVAMLLCAVPTVATLALSRWAFQKSPEHQLYVLLGGPGLRMACAGGTALVLYLYVPYFQEQPAFLIWLMICYLFTLGLEKVLLLKRPQAPASAIQ
jgi:hypothetical protein